MVTAETQLVPGGGGGTDVGGQVGAEVGFGCPAFSQVLDIGPKSVLGCVIAFGMDNSKVNGAAESLLDLF
jgi:hypothetical protein